MKITLAASVLVLVVTGAGARGQSCFEVGPYAPSGDGTGAVAFADIDGDGDLDLAAANTGAQTFSLFWNAGDGTWGSTTTLSGGGTQLTDLDFADVDADGDPDLVFTRGFGVNQLTVRRNLGGSSFGAPEVYAVGWVPEQFSFGDLDGDGDLDIAVACSGAGYGGIGVGRVLLNAGNGSYGMGSAVFAAPSRVAIADYDGDGDRDLVFVRLGESLLWLARNDGTGAFPDAPTSRPLGAAASDLLATDFDLDGRPDVAVGHSSNLVSILLGQIPGAFGPAISYPAPHASARIRAADFDADGDQDLAALSWVSNAVTVLENSGSGTFAAAGTYGVGPEVYAFDDGDFDLDGDPDIACSSYSLDAIRVLRNCSFSGTPTCFGDGSAAACPCGNASPVGADAGCLHSLGTGGTLRASGTPSLAADSLVLRGASMPNAPALYFQGTSTINGRLGAVFGDGLRCAGGSVARIGTAMNAGGASQYPGAGQPSVSVVGGVTVPAERHYQVWYRNAASFCTPATFNLTNSLRLTWRP